MPTVTTEMSNIKTSIEYILLSCCTCQRPKMLQETLESIKNLKLPENIKVEVFVVDNDGAGSARDVCNNNYNFKVHYFVEEHRGIAFARNKVLDEAVNLGATHILFFDDDEILDENCLLEHINLYTSNEKAVISSGPAFNKFTEKFPKYIENSIIFKQKTSKETGVKRKTCATNNVFFPISLIKDFNLKFSTEYVYMGGEDGDFFSKASKLGFTIIWNNNAIVYELVTKHRANINYILKKCYYNGYSSSLRKYKEFKCFKDQCKYVFKETGLFIACLLALLPSLLGGISFFFNLLCVTRKIKGKIDAAITGNPLEFYKNIYGE